MKIFLDSNILFGDPFLTQNDLKILMLGKRANFWRVYIPIIVVDELVNQFINNFREKFESVKNIERKLSRWSEKEEFHYQVHLDYDTHKEKYKNRLIKLLGENGIEILPIPNVPHEEILTRLFHKRHPFKADESGYRDYLIWKSVVACSDEKSPSILITNNHSDFGKEPSLHEDLLDCLEPGIKLQVSIFNSLKSFNEKYLSHVKIKDVGPEDINNREIFGNFSIRNWIEKEMADQIDRDLISESLFGVQVPFSHARISSIAKILRFEVLSHYNITESTIVAEIDLGVSANLSITISGSDYAKSEELRDFVGMEEGMSIEETLWWDQEEKIGIKGSISFNKKTGDYSEFDISEISSNVEIKLK